MKPVVLPEPEAVDTVDKASLDAFRLSLLKGGFEVVPESGGRAWSGPLPNELHDLTSARTMVVLIRDGWPYFHPYTFVDGIAGEHVRDDGLVCLWNDDDVSLKWLTWLGVRSRLVAWADRARTGFHPDDRALDAFLGFASHSGELATFDLKELAGWHFSDGKSGRMHGRWVNKGRLDLLPGRAHGDELTGRWFYRDRVERSPLSIDAFVAALSPVQRQAYRRGLDRDPASGEGPLRVVALIWPRFDAFDVVVISMVDANGAYGAKVLEPAPRDTVALARRAGQDSSLLATKSVVIFGAGAVGSHIALLLAEDGVGRLRLVDNDRVRPGNVVRHVAGAHAVGLHKVIALGVEIGEHAPWTSVDFRRDRPFGPRNIRQVIDRADLVVDATGHASFAAGLARVAGADGIPLVAATLFRNGAVGRAERQLAGDVPLFERSAANGFETVPRESDEEPIVLELGCSAPVNLAPPSSVVTLAGLAARMVVDTLTNRFSYPQEVIEVYRPLDTPRFARVGQLAH